MPSVRLKMDYIGQELLETRLNRAFECRCTQQQLLGKVDGASDIKELEGIAEEYDLCDYCDLTAFNRATADMFIKTLIKILYGFPKVRSRLCFVGSKSGYLKMLQRVCLYDSEVIDKLKIKYICDKSSLVEVATCGITMLDNTKYDGREKNVLATQFELCGLLDSVILDEDDFRGLGYRRLCEEIRANAKSGYHPRGCVDPNYVIYHEFGHMLDGLCELTQSAEFQKYYNGLTKAQIEEGVSRYATVNAMEFFAEAFGEYMCSDSPREMATYLVGLLNKQYKKIV